MTEAEINLYLRKKDFYDILGVSKTAEEQEIKKAYRKLALKFHPDKNQNPKSKDVFKKVSQAYDCLTNKDKRDFYDRTGNEEPQQHYQNYQQRYSQDIDPNDIFSFFFGGQNPFNNFQAGQEFNFRTRQRPTNNNQQNQRPQNANFLNLIQLLPLILIFLPTIISLFEPVQPYMMEKSYNHNQRRETQNLKYPYYVNDDFFQNARKDKLYVKRVDKQIETEVINKFRTDCHYATKNKKQFANMAYYYDRNSRNYNHYMRQAERVDISSCNKLESYSLQGIDLNQYY